MPNKRVFIVEDEFLHLENTKLVVEACGFEIAGECDHADRAETAIRAANADVILMDIALPGKLNGISLSKRILDLQTPIIFTTSFRDEETMVEASGVNPAGYLVKPIDESNLRAAITLALNRVSSPEEKIEIRDKSLLIKSGNSLQKVDVGDILWIESAGDHYSKIVTLSHQLVSRNSVSKMIELLPKNLFIRIHRAFAVNLEKITSIHEKEQVVRIGENELPVGRTYKEYLYQQFRRL